ncbi:hypothetical protein [Kosakonia oryziphila]|jgi:hypothetical protein|uniref:Uncharacterized protein n=1 Tax=Kosakonia oryziphila TaxID=1005667 RepID=A0A1C3ZXK6_9ENTR|nr:hypothetical protein [Kosakonia oryziphila]SCB87016.1 hypothetical protein GA0061070_100333 [Kosakonia oryziphila]
MNYQTTAFPLYSPRYILLGVFYLALAFFGLPAPFLYGLLMGLVFPVLVSMRLHTLSQRGQVTLLSEISNWKVYIQGIPLEEQRASLKNPCFHTSERLQQFYWRGFIARLILQLMTLGLLIQQTREIEWTIYAGIAAVAAFILLLLSIYHTLATIRDMRAGAWALQRVEAANGYQAFFQQKMRVRTALDVLFSLH